MKGMVSTGMLRYEGAARGGDSADACISSEIVLYFSPIYIGKDMNGLKRLFCLLIFLVSLLFGSVSAEEGACAHSWQESVIQAPTCTNEGVGSRKCSLCGAESTYSILRVDHSYPSGWTVRIPASCTSDGEQVRICILCNSDEMCRAIPATGHAWQSSTREATCTQAGAKTRTCSKCQATETETVPARGHSETADPGRAAGCTTGGLSEGRHCTVCGAVTLAQQSIPARGHQMISQSGTAPTCTSPGRTGGESCAQCGYSTGGEEIPATGHREIGEGNAKPATCTESGLTESKRCQICGVMTTGRMKIAPKGHKAVKDPGKAPTATENGCTDGAHCSVCGLVLEAQEMIPALGRPSRSMGSLDQLPGKIVQHENPSNEGNVLRIIPEDGRIFTVYYQADLQYEAICVTILFEAAPDPLAAFLTGENPLAALAADQDYGRFIREAQRLFSLADEGLDAEKADQMLLEGMKNPLAGDEKQWMLPFAQGELTGAASVFSWPGYEYCLIVEEAGISLMIRGIEE